MNLSDEMEKLLLSFHCKVEDTSFEKQEINNLIFKKILKKYTFITNNKKMQLII